MIERTISFERNQSLEVLLLEINELLSHAENQFLHSYPDVYEPSLLFVIGCLRSGTTIAVQWLANTGHFAYPSNFLSRFYGAPVVGAKILQLLTDPKYSYRDELADFKSKIEYRSENGKTSGLLSPNEFWYFWRRFFWFDIPDSAPSADLFNKCRPYDFRKELNALAVTFNKPFVLKALILNYNIDLLYRLFPKAIFLYTNRDPITNVSSILDARERQLGDRHNWYSFKIPEYEILRKIDDPIKQVTGQVYYINSAIRRQLSNIPTENWIDISYELFCENPEYYYNTLQLKLNALGYEKLPEYSGPKHFCVSKRQVPERDEIVTYLKEFQNSDKNK